MTAIL